MNELALFAGAGGGILGGKLLGWRTVCAVEWEPYPASVLCARQNDGLLPPFPIWDDVQTFDGHPWRGIVDVVSGGFPCQDISAAGKGAGIEGERSGMWREMARIIYEVQPRFVFVENSPMLTSRGLGTVLGDLASMGFDARWGVLGANAIGAPHQRERIWIYASNSSGERWNYRISNWKKRQLLRDKNWNASESKSEREGWFSWVGQVGADVANTNIAQRKGMCKSERIYEEHADIGSPSWWEIEPNMDRVVDGMVDRVDRLKAIGNGQVPLCAATAWRVLNENLPRGKTQ
jgi:DNA (cytosine-5)-methyltransferase 1